MFVFIFNRAISNMIFTLLWPIIPFLMQLGVIAYYIVSAVYPFLKTKLFVIGHSIRPGMEKTGI